MRKCTYTIQVQFAKSLKFTRSHKVSQKKIVLKIGTIYGTNFCILLNTSLLGGERGIRTPEPFQVNGFQDRRIQPLCHLSGDKSRKKFFSHNTAQKKT